MEKIEGEEINNNLEKNRDEGEDMTRKKTKVSSYKRRKSGGVRRTVSVKGYTRSLPKTGTKKYVPRSKRKRTTTGTKKYIPRRKRRK